MNKEQRDKLSVVLLEESLACVKRQDSEDAFDLLQLSVKLSFEDKLKRILNGDRELLDEVVRRQFDPDAGTKIIARCMMSILITDVAFNKKYKFHKQYED